jgi:hypothetical protein
VERDTYVLTTAPGVCTDGYVEIAKVHRREENLDKRKDVNGTPIRHDEFLGVKVEIPV